jgi:cytochrome b561
MSNQASSNLLAKTTHGLVAIAIIHQLLSSEWMAKPWRLTEATDLAKTLLTTHTWSGLLIAGLLVFMLAGLRQRYRLNGIGAFFPWTQSFRRQALTQSLLESITVLRQRHMPSADQTHALAKAVQGLGLLTVAFMATTGIAIWLSGDNIEIAHQIGSIHELGAVPLQLYLGGHVVMALLHRCFGQK